MSSSKMAVGGNCRSTQYAKFQYLEISQWLMDILCHNYVAICCKFIGVIGEGGETEEGAAPLE